MTNRESLRHGRSGAVTVYLAGITAAVMLFVSALIDLARIAAFERLAESAAYAGVRAVLSAYDGPLYEHYGLFGRGGTEGQTIFDRTVSGHLPPDDAGGWRLLRPRLESSVLHTGVSVGHHAVLERQILEEMKVKAPADFAMELAGRFRSLSGGMAEAAETVRTFDELQKLYDSRQRHLEDALRSMKEAAEAVAGAAFAGLIPHPTGAGSAPGTGAGTATGVAAQYGAYVSWIEADAMLEEGEEPQHTDEITAYIDMARGTAGGLRDAAHSTYNRHEAKLREAGEKLAAAEAVNSRMADVARQAVEQASMNGGFGRLDGAGDEPASAPGVEVPAAGDIRDIRATAESLVLDRSWFEAYERELHAQGADYAQLYTAANGFASAVADGLAAPSTGRSAVLTDSAGSLERAYGGYVSRYGTAGSVTAAREQALQSLRADEAQRAALEQEAKGQLEAAGTLLESVRRLPRTPEAKEAFERLRTLYEANRAANEAGVDRAGVDEADRRGRPDDEAGELPKEGGSYARGSMDKADGLFGGMADMLGTFRSELYLNEYAVSRFNRFQPQRLGGRSEGEGGGAESDDALHLSDQETEYIIYGFHDPVSNVAAALGELFALRAAIRTMEGLIEHRSLGHPLLIFAAAVVHGLKHALHDMQRLIDGGTTPLSKWAPAEVSYRDYLRLFLLLHGSREEKLSRIAALVEWNTGYRLIDVPAAVTGESRLSIELWFLPGVMKAVAAGGILRGKVVGGRYERTITAGSSY